MQGNTSGRQALACQWLLPISGPPVGDAVVTFENGTITSVLSREEHERAFPEIIPRDYGRAVALPGLINLHTHLDYSALHLFDTQSGFFPWIRGLVSRAFRWSQEEWLASALAGAKRIAASGTTCVADSSFSGAAAVACARQGLRAVVALELFGLDERRAEEIWQAWLARYDSFVASAEPALAAALQDGLVTLTVSPHAPYTVSPELWRRADAWAQEHRLPVLAHVAESTGECRWIAEEDEELDGFLRDLAPGVNGELPPLPWKGNGRSPVEHLEHFALLTDRTVAAHAVQLSDSDISLLARRSVKIAHCPRSNARLRNGTARVAELIGAGVEMGFGTDSAASNDDLDVLAEARFAWNLRRAVAPSFDLDAADAIHRLTLGAARVLGLADRIGSLEPGKEADIAVFSLGDASPYASNPYELLLFGGARLKDLFVKGRQIVSGGVAATAAKEPGTVPAA